jgi:anti-sigma regulatory factor (Ser/Thr protein kinase)
MSLVGAENLNDSFPAVAASVPMARNAVTEFAAAAGASERQLESIRLAASEAVTNIVLHAYNGIAGRIHVNAAVASSELWVLIADDGRGLLPGSDSPGLGVGLALIAEITDGFAIVNRATGGTEVRMRFSLRPAEYSPEDQPRGSRAAATRPASSSFSITT